MTEQLEPNADKAAAAAPADNAPHILIVDDDKRIRELVARFLQTSGFRVTMAGEAWACRVHGRATPRRSGLASPGRRPSKRALPRRSGAVFANVAASGASGTRFALPRASPA
jgi:hypothetical protein